METEDQAKSTAVHQPIAWETKEGGFFDRFWRTIKQVLLQPKSAFTPPFAKDFGPALFFGIMMGLFGAFVGSAWELLLSGGEGLTILVLLLVIIMDVARAALGLIIAGAIMHLFVWIFRGSKGGFSTTMRVVCYCQAIQLFAVVPVVGAWVGMFWGLVILVIGLAAAHQIGWVRSLLAVLAPIVIVILLFGSYVWDMVAQNMQAVGG